MVYMKVKVFGGFAAALLAHQAVAQSAAVDEVAADWKAGALAVYADVQEYRWKSDSGASGHQALMPITATYRHENTEFGLRTAWVHSANTTAGRSGSVSTMTDTAFSAAHSRNIGNDWSVRFNADYNMPTGKATLAGSEKFAIMDGNLVSQTRFGEGHNITPGVVLTKVLNPNSSVGAGLSHTRRGRYDPNGDVENDVLDPGDESRLTIQGQYGTENLMLLGGVIYTHSGKTRFGGQDYFRKGSRTDLNFTGIFALPKAQTLTFGARYGRQRPDAYVSNITGNFEKESRNINGDSTYVSLEYSKRWQEKHTLKMLVDWLSIDANSYDQFNDLYNAGRIKYSIGLGYDYQWKKGQKMSVTIRDFKMRDKATPATLMDGRYSGYSISAALNINF